jgi:hypothetical protein
MVMMGIVPDRTELERVRTLCLALPEVTERPSHGSPTWFVRGKNDPNPRGRSGTAAGWACTSYRGLDWNEIAGAIEEAYLQIAPKRLAEEAIRARG